MITRADKKAEIQGLSDRFGRAKAAFLIDFKGMNVEQVTDLRKKLNPAEAEMRVVRNTLAKLALKEFPETESALSESFTGTNAIVFAYGEDVAAPAQILTDFAKDVEVLQLKTGVMDGKALGEEGVKFLATLPSKDVLRAQLLGLLQEPASKFVRTLAAVPSGFARVLAARKGELEKGA